MQSRWQCWCCLVVSRPVVEAVGWWRRDRVAGRSRRSEWHEVVQRRRREEKLCG